MPLEQTVKAFDFSYWNTHAGPLNTDILTREGIKVCMVRAGKGKNTLAEDFGVDRSWYSNVQALVDAGILYMPYWRIFNLEESSPVAQAQNFAAALNAVNYNMFRAPVWIDCEEWQFLSDNEHLHADMVSHWIVSFMNTLAEHGYRYQGIYTRANWWGNNFSPIGVMNGHPLWVAHWPTAVYRKDFESYSHDPETWDEYVDNVLPAGPALPAAWQDWDAWQFIGTGSGAGQMYGFDSEDIDCNLIKKTSFDRWFGT